MFTGKSVRRIRNSCSAPRSAPGGSGAAGGAARGTTRAAARGASGGASGGGADGAGGAAGAAAHGGTARLEGRPARASLSNNRRDIRQHATEVHSYGERIWLHGGTAAGGWGCQGD